MEGALRKLQALGQVLKTRERRGIKSKEYVKGGGREYMEGKYRKKGWVSLGGKGEEW